MVNLPQRLHIFLLSTMINWSYYKRCIRLYVHCDVQKQKSERLYRVHINNNMKTKTLQKISMTLFSHIRSKKVLYNECSTNLTFNPSFSKAYFYGYMVQWHTISSVKLTVAMTLNVNSFQSGKRPQFMCVGSVGLQTKCKIPTIYWWSYLLVTIHTPLFTKALSLA